MYYYDLFSGLGGFSTAIKNQFPNAKCLGFSEICKTRTQIYLNHFPNHQQLGDISLIDYNSLPKTQPTLVTLGFPCKDLSIQNQKRKGLKGKKSRLFFNAIEFIKHTKPEYFIVENVNSMSKEDRIIISETLGVQPTRISSRNFTGQERIRLYWTNIPIPPLPNIPIVPTRTLPNGKTILIHAYSKSVRPKTHKKDKPYRHYDERIRIGSANTLTASPDSSESVNFFPDKKDAFLSSKTLRRTVLNREDLYYYQIPDRWLLTANEAEILQGFPINYTKHQNLSDNKRKSFLGDAVTIPVIEHILKGLK